MAQAFINAKIITITSDIYENGTLIIDNGKITHVGSAVSTEGMEIVDCTGKTITPGFIDAHSHVGLFEEGVGRVHSDGNEMTSPITPHLRALDAIYPEDMGFQDAREGGVVTLGITPGSGNLIGGQFAVVKTYGTIVDEMVIKEPAGMKMALGENAKRVGSEAKRAPTTRMGNAYLIREALIQTQDYLNEWETYEKQLAVATDDKPVKRPARNLKYELLGRLLKKEFPARCHAHRDDDIVTAVRIAEEFGLDLVIEHTTEGHKIDEFLAKKNIPVIVGPLPTSRSKRELRDRNMSTPAVLMKKGLTVCITTDAPVIPIYTLRDTVAMAIRAGLPEERALETITINPAKVLGLADRIGSLEVGKDADFLIFGGDPLDVRNPVEQTYIDGKKVFDLNELN